MLRSEFAFAERIHSSFYNRRVSALIELAPSEMALITGKTSKPELALGYSSGADSNWI